MVWSNIINIENVNSTLLITKFTLSEDEKNEILKDLNSKIGSDINDLTYAYLIDNELATRQKQLQSNLTESSIEVPNKLSSAITKAEKNSKQIENLKEKSEKLKEKVEGFLTKTQPLRDGLQQRFAAIQKMEEVVLYLKSFEKVEDLSSQLKQCSDDEQAVILYGQIKDLSIQYSKGHRAIYLKECTHYWHNILRDKFTKQYEEIIKQLKWPLTGSQDDTPPSKEIMIKFNNITRHLLLIEVPKNNNRDTVSEDLLQEQDACLPVKILLRPLKKRFTFHFTGSRQTARLDRPEWFLTQTLTWVKDHMKFIKRNVQIVADKLKLRHVRAVDEFNSGLVAFAAERLHNVLSVYLSQESKGEMMDVDAAFAHAVDETLGFHKELVALTDNKSNSVISVLTKAETFVRWLGVEKKYALAKMDDALSSEQWMEGVAAGFGSAVGALVWVPRSADWVVALLKTIEERYTMLPQPGHRLQFLELQLELIEEWRVRLTQLQSAAIVSLNEDTFLVADSSPHPLTAVVNAAHYTKTVLLQWAQSLHYLQLHFYRRQFQQFTQQQHHDEDTEFQVSDEMPRDSRNSSHEVSHDETMSLREVEVKAERLALTEVSQRSSMIVSDMIFDDFELPPVMTILQLEPEYPYLNVEDDEEDAGVFGEAPALFSNLRDAGMTALSDHIFLEFKAALHEYKKQKWHSMPLCEEMSLTVSSALCRPLSTLCGRLQACSEKLAPALACKLRTHLAHQVDIYLFQEVVLESWWNTGGTIQFTHDVERAVVPVFAPPSKVASPKQLPRLHEACILLNMDYGVACRLRTTLEKVPPPNDGLSNVDVRNIVAKEALQILNQRTDLAHVAQPSVMELF